jgi:NADPH:quinone reductase-like Zn-dependent oxidoreductase
VKCPVMHRELEGTMKAVVFNAYGGNDVLGLREVPRPAIKADEVLIRVHAAGVNPVDWKVREGQAKILTGGRFPKVLGIECSGEIVETGSFVKKFRAGDAVIANAGMWLGAYAEYVAVKEKTVFPKPELVAFEDAATLPIAGLTALQALRDKGRIVPGRKVLINGASGGVGTFAVQIAKILGAGVTAVCSAANAGLVKELGADHVIDYCQQDFTKTAERYDCIFDVVSSRSFGECKKALTRSGVYVNTLPTPSIFWNIFITTLLPGKRAATMMVSQRASDIEWMCKQLKTGRLKVVIDSVFPLDEIKGALEYSQTGRARGKIVLKIL